MICNSKYINNCYKKNETKFHSRTPGYRKEYYREHREKLLNHQKKYYQDHKKRIQYIKSLWFQKHKSRLRKKHGFIRKYNTKPKDNTNTEIIKKNIILSFD